MKFNPRSYQVLAIEFLMRTPRAGLFAQPGLGKSPIALTVIDRLRLLSAVDRVLVVVPKRVMDTEGWQREIAKWDHLSSLAIEAITGDAARRRTLLSSPKPIHLINYELVPWLLDELESAWPYDMVILDESTRVKGHDSTWFKGNPRTKEHIALGSKLVLPDGRDTILTHDTKRVFPGNTRVYKPAVETHENRLLEFLPTAGLKHIAERTARWVNLTGTPMSNGAKDLWSQTYLLDQGARLGENISRFRETYQHPNPYVKHVYNDQPDALPRVIAKVQDICLSIKAADYLDLPELITTQVEVPLGAELMKRYLHLEDQFYIALEEGTVEAANSAVLANKLLQFTSGAMYTDKAGHWEAVHSHRIDALRELTDEIGGPCLVAYHFASSLERIKKAIPDAVQFDGTRGMIDAFCAGKIRHLLLHPQSAGHGIDGLQDGTDSLVFFDGTWSLENHDQVIERIGPTRQLQSGHPRPVFVYYLMTPNTADEQQLERVREKKSLQEIFMNAMQRRKK